MLAIAVDNMIKIYNPLTKEFEKALTGHSKTIYALQALPNGNLLSAG
jgi:WD40 repeat protein